MKSIRDSFISRENESFSEYIKVDHKFPVRGEKMHDIKRGTASIHYEWIEAESGDAEETIVLIHAIGLDLSTWDFVIPYFRKHYDIIRYDIRGHGQSDVGNSKLTTELLSNDLMHLLADLEIDTFHIVAQGIGGYIAISVAAKKQEALKTITLMNVPLYFSSHLWQQHIRVQKAIVKGDHTMVKLANEVGAKACYLPTEKKRSMLHRSFHRVSPDVYFQLFHPQLGKSALQRMKNFKKPILLLSGAEDQLFPSELSTLTLSFLPSARHYTIPRASLMLQFDQPEMMVDMITTFIKNNDKPNNPISFVTDYKKMLMKQMYKEYCIDNVGVQEQPAPQPMLTVNVMNGFDVEWNGKKIMEGWNKRKAKQLFIYLVLVQSTTRDDLCDVLWPNIHLENAKNRLRVSLHYLKRLLQDGTNDFSFIYTDREHVRLQVQVRCDLLDHMEHLKKAHHIQNRMKKAEMYICLLEKRANNPLPGLFEDWFLDLQLRIEKQWADMAVFLVDFFEDIGEYKRGLYYLQYALNYYVDDPRLIKKNENIRNKSIHSLCKAVE